jgi:hypothetical protein
MSRIEEATMISPVAAVNDAAASSRLRKKQVQVDASGLTEITRNDPELTLEDL